MPLTFMVDGTEMMETLYPNNYYVMALDGVSIDCAWDI